MENNISKTIYQCKKLIDAMGHEIDCIDNGIISVDKGLWQIVTGHELPLEMYLSFHVNIGPIMAASISMRFSYRASMFVSMS